MGLDLLAIGVARKSGDPAPIEMLFMTKLWQKKPIVSSVSVSFSIFCVQRFLLAFVNNIDDQGPQAPLKSIFANQFKCKTWKKLRVFVLQFAISSPHLTFLLT